MRKTAEELQEILVTKNWKKEIDKNTYQKLDEAIEVYRDAERIFYKCDVIAGVSDSYIRCLSELTKSCDIMLGQMYSAIIGKLNQL